MQNLSRLQQLTPTKLDRYTRQVVRDLARRRLLLGRCLLAMDRTGAARRLGFSSSIHYARALGVEYREALEARRVAARLEELPLLRAVAELGNIPWSSLREIVRKASAATEARWLELARLHPYKVIEKLVRSTRAGEMPGEGNDEVTVLTAEQMLHFLMTDDGRRLFAKVSREVSEQEGRGLSNGEVLELMCLKMLHGATTPEARARASAEVERDRQAEAEAHAAQVAAAVDQPVRVDVTMLDWRNERLRYSFDQRATPAQLKEMLRRDGYRCSTPACPNRCWLQSHHVIEFAQGGPSIPSNLIVVCSACHRNLHRGYLVVVGEAPHWLHWCDSSGRRLMWDRLGGEELEDLLNPHGSDEEELDEPPSENGPPR